MMKKLLHIFVETMILKILKNNMYLKYIFLYVNVFIVTFKPFNVSFLYSSMNLNTVVYTVSEQFLVKLLKICVK